MEAKDLELIDQLISDDQELAHLWHQHLEMENRLEVLSQRRYLTPEEEVEVKRLKKVKLAGKDRIEGILASHREEDGAEE